jgi:hypothetical protein
MSNVTKLKTRRVLRLDKLEGDIAQLVTKRHDAALQIGADLLKIRSDAEWAVPFNSFRAYCDDFSERLAFQGIALPQSSMHKWLQVAEFAEQLDEVALPAKVRKYFKEASISSKYEFRKLVQETIADAPTPINAKVAIQMLISDGVVDTAEPASELEFRAARIHRSTKLDPEQLANVLESSFDALIERLSGYRRNSATFRQAAEYTSLRTRARKIVRLLEPFTGA